MAISGKGIAARIPQMLEFFTSIVPETVLVYKKVTIFSLFLTLFVPSSDPGVAPASSNPL
jgi:hypothetical protein